MLTRGRYPGGAPGAPPPAVPLLPLLVLLCLPSCPLGSAVVEVARVDFQRASEYQVAMGILWVDRDFDPASPRVFRWGVGESRKDSSVLRLLNAEPTRVHLGCYTEVVTFAVVL